LASCALGPRPTLGPPGGGTADGPTGNTEVDALLARLDAVGSSRFTANYTLTRLLGPVTAEATVVQDPPTTSVTVGDNRFLKGGTEQTCSMATKVCQTGLIEQRLADLAMSSSFYAASPAAQIRVSYQRRSAEPTFNTAPIGGITADCVGIPLGPGTERYCVAPNGIIASVDRADTQTLLNSVIDTADPAALGPPS
jgi:hypothetical protein